MIDRIHLPKRDEDLAAVVNNHCARYSGYMRARWTKWLLAQLYLQGYRVFTAYDANNIVIETAETHASGDFPLKLSGFVDTINKTQGLLSSLDLRPRAVRQGLSLAAIRERAMSQVIADSIFDIDQLNRIAPSFAFYFGLFGSCGLCGHLENSPRVGPTVDIEVVHPREVIPFPDPGTDYTKIRGRIRERFVPIEDLRETYGSAFITRNMSNLHTYSRTLGTTVDSAQHAPFFSGTPGDNSVLTGNPEATIHTVARLREIYIIGERNTLLEYAAVCGTTVLHRRRMDREQAYCPLSWARFIDVGSFHGAGLFDVLFSQIREFEKLFESLINNIRNADRYPLVILPHGTINERTTMRDTGHGLRYTYVNPEAKFDGSPPIRPVVVSPVDSGDLPGRTAAYLKQVIDESSPIRDLIREKGRIDSLPALQFLAEQDAKPTAMALSSMAMAFGDLFRYGVSAAISKLTTTAQPLPINRLDLDLLGAVIDFENSTVSLDQNLIPDVSRVSFEIRRNPQSEALLKQEIQSIASLQATLTGRGDWTTFMLTVLKHGIDLPWWMEDYKAAYRTVTMNILTIVNNGRDPGLVFLTPNTEMPEVQLKVLSAVMASPETRLMHPRVIDALQDYREQLTAMVGGVLPPNVPDPFAGLQTQSPPTLPQ